MHRPTCLLYLPFLPTCLLFDPIEYTVLIRWTESPRGWGGICWLGLARLGLAPPMHILGLFRSSTLWKYGLHLRDITYHLHPWTFYSKESRHNIIQIHTSVMWDWHSYAKYSSHLDWIRGIFCRILSVPQNTAMGLNIVMGVIPSLFFL